MIPIGSVLVVVLGVGAQVARAPANPAGATRDRAIGALLARAAQAAPGSPEASQVAGELEKFGAGYLAEGDNGRATELLAEAYVLDEENGLILAELTLAYVRAGDLDSARFYLGRAEERVAHAPPQIYGVLGDAYFGLHRLDDAVVAWSEFFRFGGSDPARLGRLAQTRDELALSRGQRSMTLPDFTLFADPGVGEDLARRAGEDLDAAYAAQSSLLGRRLDRRQVVILHSGRAYFALASVPDWVSGVYDGKIRVSVEAGAPAPASVLAHELAHALIRSAAGDRAPAWFHEGLAQWCEGRRLPVREVRGAVGARPAGSLDELEQGFGRPLPRAAARSAYAQALSLVEFLIAARGIGAVACVLARLAGEGAPFGEALRGETGMSEKEVFAGWKRWAGA